MHGDGPLSVLLTDGLRCSGARVSQSHHGNAFVAGADLVVLADALATDPRLLPSCTPHGCRTCRCGCATGPGSSGRW